MSVDVGEAAIGNNVNYIVGDLFDYVGNGFAIGHGVNCKGSMGAGIARPIGKMFPSMYEQYHARCIAGLMKPGDCFEWYENDTWVMNMASQDYPGPDAKEQWLRAALYNAALKCITIDVPLYIPMIGAGIGGLTEQAARRAFFDVSEFVAGHATGSKFKLNVVVLP